jgi:hypothetical protein
MQNRVSYSCEGKKKLKKYEANANHLAFRATPRLASTFQLELKEFPFFSVSSIIVYLTMKLRTIFKKGLSTTFGVMSEKVGREGREEILIMMAGSLLVAHNLCGITRSPQCYALYKEEASGKLIRNHQIEILINDDLIQKPLERDFSSFFLNVLIRVSEDVNR